MLFLEANFSDGSYIFLSILALIITVGITLFLFYAVKKERLKMREEEAVLLEGLLTKSELNSSINAYLSKITIENEFALIYVDLDKYLEIVNAFGQKDADKALEKISQNISKVLPRRVQMSRYRGDEFLIFLKTDIDRNQVMDLAKRILEVVRTPIKIFEETFIYPTGSIGVAYYPKHGRTLKQMLNSLKIAIYIAKKTGGNNILIYSNEMDEKEGKNIDYYYQIKNALKNQEFVLYYQPIINHETNKIYGVESLLRWNHPEQGVLNPSQFINIIEQSGDIYRVGLTSMENLVKKYFEFTKQFPNLEAKFSFNLSPKQLVSETLPVDFQNIIKKYKISASNITLEIVEFALYDRSETILKNIYKFKELGFNIAIDGFGLDYTTLSNLENLPIDIIKLDKEFLTKDESYVKNQFASLLIGFAEKNQKTIICEGIENEEMLNKAIKYGIKIFQGYHYSKPLSSEEIITYIKEEKWNKIN